MFKAFISLLLTLAASIGIYSPGLARLAPCTVPLQYSIGSFDRHFGVSFDGFVEALSEAEVIWEKPLGRDLFNYSPEKGALKVNLVYDYRQQVTKTLSSIESTLEQGNSQYKDLDKVYRSRKAQYDALKASYDADAQAWEAHSSAYQAQVDRWNVGPRTSQSDFRTLEAARASLEAEAQALKAKESQLNALAKDVNSLVSQLNSLAKELNLGVSQYNEVGQERGETFTGGLYTSDENGEKIDIFEFETHDELVRLLAHELGHALGLEHVSDPNAIMYYLDKSGTKATDADLAALKTLCGVK